MKLLEKIIYGQVLMMVMVIWVVPMSYGHGDDVPMHGRESDAPVTDDVPDPTTSISDGTGPPTSNDDGTSPPTSNGAGPSTSNGDGTGPPTSNDDGTGTPTSNGDRTGPPTSKGDGTGSPTSNGDGTGPSTSNGDGADAPTAGDGTNVPLPSGDVPNPPNGGDGTDAPESGWHEARATFYGDINGGETQQGACGYGNLHKQGYGLETAALSTALFNNGYTCGACYEIKCVNSPQWCLPGSIKITATNFCPPDYSKTQDCWCNPPQKHFDLSQPMYLKIAKYKSGVVPVRYRRVPCAKTGGVKFEIKGNPHFLMILPYNVGGAGDIKAMHVKGTKTEWIPMKKNWGQIWNTGVVLTGQCLSFRITTSDGITKDFMDVTPPTWGCNGQSFDGKVNF